MASAGIRNPLSPYDNYRDCSLGICSIYCTQFCYFIFPPPPPSDDAPRNPFSPLIIAVIGVLVGAFLLVSYYMILTKFCNTRRGNDHRHRSSGVNSDNNNTEGEENRDGEWPAGPAGMDAYLIGKIKVCEYKKGGGLIEGTECAVCLSDFQEDELLRLLPKCSHAFHLPCIDMWLKTQSSCPLCRANVAMSDTQDSTAVNVDVSASAINRPDDLVLLVEDRVMERMVVISDDADEEEGRDNEEGSSDQDGVAQFRRPVSFAQRQLLVSDILMFEEIDDYVRVEIDGLWRGNGSSGGDGDDKGIHGNLLRSPVAMKRLVPRFRQGGLWTEARATDS